MKSNRSWRWKVADEDVSRRLGLLYEPGNWGDLLKGPWALAALEALDIEPGSRPLRLVDAFAGRPEYPLLPGAARRIERCFPDELPAGLAGFLDRGVFPSTSSWARAAAEGRGHRCELEVFDLSPEAREAWSATPGVRLLPGDCGYRALAGLRPGDHDLAIVDPYDLFDRWRECLGDLLELATATPTLLYLYNKAPRGAGHFQNHRALEAAIRERPAGLLALLGRCPSDGRLPRATHDVVMLGPESLLRPLEARLREFTETLAWEVSREGFFEEL